MQTIDEWEDIAHHAHRSTVEGNVTFYKGQKWRRRKRSKHASACVKVRATSKQREHFKALKRELAEKGYQIYPVAVWFRRTAYDFVAVPKKDANHLLVVRIAPKEEAEVRYYAAFGAYYAIKRYLATRQHVCGRVRWGRQLPVNGDYANGWRAYISRRCGYELRLLTDAG